MVARTVEFLKEEQIGNICLFADADGELSPATCIGVLLVTELNSSKKYVSVLLLNACSS